MKDMCYIQNLVKVLKTVFNISETVSNLVYKFHQKFVIPHKQRETVTWLEKYMYFAMLSYHDFEDFTRSNK